MAREVTLDDDEVVIGEKEYAALLDDSFLLNCLRNAGVDNTDQWEYALEEYREGTELGDE